MLHVGVRIDMTFVTELFLYKTRIQVPLILYGDRKIYPYIIYEFREVETFDMVRVGNRIYVQRN
jgi:hypothetical protein